MLTSAMNTVGRALGHPLEITPADPARLRPLLEPVTPTVTRLPAGFRSNAGSMLCAPLIRGASTQC